MEQSPSPSASPAPQQPSNHNKHRLKRWITGITGVLLLALLSGAGFLFYAVQSEYGTQLLWQIATRVLPGRLSGNMTGGTLAHELHMRNVVYHDGETRISTDRLDAQWQLTWSPLKLTVNYLRAGIVEVHLPLTPSPSPPLLLPAHLRLPLQVTLNELSLQKLSLHKDVFATELRDILIKGESDQVQHTIALQKMETPSGSANGTLRVNGMAPFIVNGDIGLTGAYQQEHYQIDGHVSGTLAALAIQFNATGDKLNGSGQIDATPFALVPLQRAQFNINHVNPKAFSATAPQADLNLQASLAPVPDNASLLVVNGPVTLTNAQPGALDKDRLPLISATANVRLDNQQQQFSQITLKLLNTALLEGHGELDSKGAGTFTFKTTGLDLHALHGTLKPSRLSGPIILKLAPDTQHVSIKLADTTYQIQAEAGIDARKFTLHTANLTAGPARLALSGSLDRDTAAKYTLKGKLTDFNPTLWLTTTRPAPTRSTRRQPVQKAVEGHMNADVEINGTLSPEQQLKMIFKLNDSTYDHLPMTGNGMIHIAGQRLLPSEANILIAGNQLMLKGSFGTSADRLNIRINAPQLHRLGFGLAGTVQLDGQMTGTLAQPGLHASYRAEQLVFGSLRVASMSGQADIQTPLNANIANTRVAINVQAQGYQGPDISLNKLTATLNGTYGDHMLNIETSGLLRNQPLALTIAAQGKLNRIHDDYGWDGIVRTLENRGMPRFSLGTPMTLRMSPERIVLGATRMTLANALIDLKNFSYEEGQIRSAGSASELNIGHLFELRRAFSGVEAPVKTNLVLDGNWDFTLADTASGFIQIARRQGDVTISSGRGEAALGISQLNLRADLQANRITFDAQVAATRIGTLTAQGQTSLQRQNGKLIISRDAPLSGQATITVPQLKSVGALIGPQIALDGGMSMHLLVSGTIGHPAWSGNINGDKLALTLFDEGIQLHDGIVRVALKENLIELRQIEFHGGEGTLRASGQVQLDRPDPDLTANIIADHLQLFASPDHQLVLSGQAKVSNNVNNQLHINGKFTVDNGLFDLPKSSTPRLGNDVVIVQRSGKLQAAAPKPQEQLAQVSKKPASRFSPYMDILVELGNSFRFRGADADLLLGGSMNVHSEPYRPLEAIGTIRVVEGTYEVFGRKLAIERGLINFQGPLDNPNLTILAMRRNQEVEAGVQITGNVRQPRVKLVSEPNVAEEEKLSWLMFGHGSDSTGLGQQQAAGAALALLNNTGGKRIARGIGLDELSIGSSESGLNDQQVVNLGKAISDQFYIGYEQSLTGAANIVKITWQLSKRWSMVARGGAINSLDMLFTRRFD